MQTTLDKIDALNKEYQALLPMKAEHQHTLDKKLRMEFNYNSNHLEGNTLTYSQTELLLIFEDTKGVHSMREYDEMRGHDVAYSLIKDWATEKERTLTEQNIKNLNEILLVRPFWKDAQTADGQSTRRQIKVGDYKEYPNSVRLQNGEIFEYASPTDTPIKMQELMDWYRTNEGKLHPVTLAAMLHYKFVLIHPFDDGNGRVSRLLMNYVFLRNGFPPVIIKTDDKANYLKALHAADTGDFESFIDYIAQQLLWSLDIAIKAAKGESIEEHNDLDKKLALLKKQIEVEDLEHQIKVELNGKVIQEAINNWILDLFGKLEKTSNKFNDFYNNYSTNFDVTMDNTSATLSSFVELEGLLISIYFQNIMQGPYIQNAVITYRRDYGVYKNGGVNPFSCSYSVSVEFSKISFEVSISIFDKIRGKTEKTAISKRLLHKQATQEEMDAINKQWGESLFNHLEYKRKNIKNEQ